MLLHCLPLLLSHPPGKTLAFNEFPLHVSKQQRVPGEKSSDQAGITVNQYSPGSAGVSLLLSWMFKYAAPSYRLRTSNAPLAALPRLHCLSLHGENKLPVVYVTAEMCDEDIFY